MKPDIRPPLTIHLPRTARAGFSIAELMTAMSLFSLVLIAVLSSHLLGLRMFNITATKLSASANARQALNVIRDDIRSAKLLYVGSGDGTGFTNVPQGRLRQGNALQVYPTTATNNFVRYYLDWETRQLKKIENGATQPTIVANYITNQIAFSIEDYAGNILTNDQNNRVVRMSLEFYQWEFPVARAGAGAFYDYYHLQTRITRRTIE